jgi:hypothetical protein
MNKEAFESVLLFLLVFSLGRIIFSLRPIVIVQWRTNSFLRRQHDLCTNWRFPSFFFLFLPVYMLRSHCRYQILVRLRSVTVVGKHQVCAVV